MSDATPAVRITIDDKPIEVTPGLNLIEAAKGAGIEIPYYCYHPRLSIAANCRMCLVEVSNAPKLVPACQTPAVEGLAVKTKTARVKEAQRSVLEFLLLNHPVDCSICDQAGECKLQDYYMRYDFKPSRLVGDKVMKSKRKILGPSVVLDQERCILCTRCVRFMREVAKEPQLGVFGRGSHEVIDTFPGQPLTSNYAGNTVDICPVGALLNRDFRFKARAFFLSTTPSVCAGCSRGCSTFLDFFNGQAYRYRPRENAKVNDVWMCDRGRASWRTIVEGRLLAPRVGRGDDTHEVTQSEATKLAAELLNPHRRGEALAFCVSPGASVEDLLAAFQLAQEGLGQTRAFVLGDPDAPGDAFLLKADRNPNRTGLTWIAKAFGFTLHGADALLPLLERKQIQALYIVGGEIPEREAELAAAVAALPSVVQAARETPLAKASAITLPASTHAEDHGTFVNFEGVIQRFVGAYPPTARSRPHWSWAGALLQELGARKERWAHAREVFRELGGRVAELAGFDWDQVPRYLKQPGSLWAMPAAADGRPAGYRERSLK